MSRDTSVWRTDPYRQVANAKPPADDAWQSYHRNRDDSARRDELILRYAPLVKRTVGRLSAYLPAGFDFEDLIGHGTVGLIEAIDRYDPSQGAKFETYAVRRIWGSMIDALRNLSIMPRTTTRQVRELNNARVALEGELGRVPSTLELAERLGVEESAVFELLAAAEFSLVSLEAPIGSGEDEGFNLRETIASKADGPDQSTERKELLGALTNAIEDLPERERLVLSLYYHDELTLKEIGKVLQISEPRVSQLHAAAISRLRLAMAAHSRDGGSVALRLPIKRPLVGTARGPRSSPVGGPSGERARPLAAQHWIGQEED